MQGLYALRRWTHILSKTYVSVNALDRLPGFQQALGAAQASQASRLSMPGSAFAESELYDSAPHQASARPFHSARIARALHTRPFSVNRLLGESS